MEPNVHARTDFLIIMLQTVHHAAINVKNAKQTQQLARLALEIELIQLHVHALMDIMIMEFQFALLAHINA